MLRPDPQRLTRHGISRTLQGLGLFPGLDVLENVMARRKAYYDGHPVAAVAAVSPAIAREALRLISVAYEVLPHVTDVEAATAAPAASLIFSAAVSDPVP